MQRKICIHLLQLDEYFLFIYLFIYRVLIYDVNFW